MNGRTGYLAFALCCALVLQVHVWLVTHGTYALAALEDHAQFYDALADSLVEGRLDVPAETLGDEAIEVDGRYYGYFGPTPALPRIVLNALWPAMHGRWSRAMLLGCALGQLLLLAWLLRCRGVSLGRPLAVGFLVTVGLGSTQSFVSARAFLYHEAIAWGALLTIACACALLRAVERPESLMPAAVAGACAVGALLARVSTGGAAVAACLVVAAAPGRATRGQRIVLLMAIVGAVGAYLALNQARFGAALDGAPVERTQTYVKYPDRLRRIEGRKLHPQNALFLAVEYLGPTRLRFRVGFPWIAFPDPPWSGRAPERFDLVEPHASLTATSPALVVLAVIGLLGRATDRASRRIALVLLFPLPLMLAFACLSHRYLHDLLPVLAVAGALGVAACPPLDPARRVLIAGLVAWSVVACVSLAAVFQREIIWGVSIDSKAQWLELRRRVDALTGAPRPTPYDR